MQAKIKVLNVMTTVQDGGMETLIYRIYKCLDRNIYDLHIYALINSPENFLVKNYKEIGIDVHFFRFINKNIGIKGAFNNIIQFLILSKEIYKNKFNVVHSHDFFSAAITRFALLLNILFFRKPDKIFVTLHNLFSWLKPYHHKINKFLSLFTDKIVCVSKSVYLHSKERDKIKESKYTVIYNAIDINEFYNDKKAHEIKRKHLNIKPDEILIGNVGTFSVRKGQMYLLKAFNKLLQKYPYVKLAIVGGSRSHEKDVEKEVHEFITDNNLKESVILLDVVKDINSLYNAFDIFVMSSITEGFSLASLEAMLTEKICVFSDIGPFKELVDDSYNGFLFESKNYESLYNKFDYVIENFNNLTYISKNARNSVIERFSYETMIKSYSDLYNVN